MMLTLRQSCDDLVCMCVMHVLCVCLGTGGMTGSLCWGDGCLAGWGSKSQMKAAAAAAAGGGGSDSRGTLFMSEV